MCQPTKTKVVVTGVVGFILLALGCALIPLGNYVIEYFVKQDTILVPGSVSYETWLNIPTPIYMQFWGWDITNPEEFLAGGVPHLMEKGPYTYQEYREKLNVTHNDNGTVSYIPKTTYIFRRELSVGPESDTFTTVNLVALTVATLIQHNPQFQGFQYLLNEITDTSLLITVPIGDFVFGYNDPYLEFFAEQGVEIPTKFGLFLHSNGTEEKTLTINTGEEDIGQLGEIEVWGGKTELEWWSDPYANMINGTDGTIFRPLLTRDDDLYVFVDDICRAGFLQYNYPGKIRGIPISHYSIPALLYANVSYYPDNLGFCTPPGNLPCVPNGLLNVSACQAGAPVYFSSPHFLYGDPILFQGVSGLHPIRDQHETSFDIEMISGVTFQAHNRIQINTRVGPFLQFKDARMVSEAYLPVIWLNESSQVDKANADFYITESLIPQYILLGLIVLLISVGGGLFVGAIVTFIVIKRDQSEMREGLVFK